MKNMNMQFGPAGITDAGARLRAQEGAASLRHAMGVSMTEPHLAGEQLR